MKKFKKIIVGAMLVMAQTMLQMMKQQAATRTRTTTITIMILTMQEMQSAMQWKMSVMQQGMLEKVS